MNATGAATGSGAPLARDAKRVRKVPPSLPPTRHATSSSTLPPPLPSDDTACTAGAAAAARIERASDASDSANDIEEPRLDARDATPDGGAGPSLEAEPGGGVAPPAEREAPSEPAAPSSDGEEEASRSDDSPAARALLSVATSLSRLLLPIGPSKLWPRAR